MHVSSAAYPLFRQPRCLVPAVLLHFSRFRGASGNFVENCIHFEEENKVECNCLPDRRINAIIQRSKYVKIMHVSYHISNNCMLQLRIRRLSHMHT